MLSITAAALAGMLVHILAPSGGTKKAVRMLVTVFFLAAFFLPFTKLSADDFALSWGDFESSESPVEAVVASQADRARGQIITQEVKNFFTARGLPIPNIIEVDGDFLRVQPSSAAFNASALERALLENLGVKITVVIM